MLQRCSHGAANVSIPRAGVIRPDITINLIIDAHCQKPQEIGGVLQVPIHACGEAARRNWARKRLASIMRSMMMCGGGTCAA